jgi:helicase
LTSAAIADRMFHGLFVGINQYGSRYFSDLRAAVRDATALHALFSDNLGGDCRLVTDRDATLSRLREELRELQKASSEDDTVVVAFSGHGSETHHLIPYGADWHNLLGTALPLDELTGLVGGIPARHLLVVLDCCFSGGAGSKVLNTPAGSRGRPTELALSTTALLDKMAGTGRVILTASTADQEAWEDLRPGCGHGLLTYHLLQAFLGPEEVSHGERINLYDLLKYVTEQVKASASSVASARQEPTLRGRWDGEVLWPVFKPGQRYLALFPSSPRPPVTADLRSLREHGIPEPVLDRWTQDLRRGLNQLQQDAVNQAGLLEGRNVLIMAPTSSGKTMIGELAALRATQHGGRSVFLLPMRALVNEQQDKFERLYGPAGVRTIRCTGEFTDQVPALLRGQFDIAVLTYEMFTRLALAHPHLLRLITTIVIDEAQNLVDPGRGPGLEFLLTLVKSRTGERIKPQLIALSAVLGDLGGLDSWLDAHLLCSSERPVPLEEGVLDLTGVYHYIAADGADRTEQFLPRQWQAGPDHALELPVVRKLVATGQQVIVVRSAKRQVRSTAFRLANELGLKPAADALAALPSGDPSSVSDLLGECLRHGVAFHFSDLDRDERRVIEDAFRKREIQVLVATTTLAQGVNLPAETVVIPELKRFDGHGDQPYRVAEYKNIAGRAGRLGLTERGRAIVLASSYGESENLWSRYITATPENVRSALFGVNADMHTLLLRVMAMASRPAGTSGLSRDELAVVLSNSFAAHQNRLRGGGDAFGPAKIVAVLTELKAEKFLENNGSRLQVTPLGKIVANGGLTVWSATVVARAFRKVRSSDINRATLIAAAQLTAELDKIRLPVDKDLAQEEFARFGNELRKQKPAPAVFDALSQNTRDEVTAAARAKKAFACLLWMSAMPAARIELTVMRPSLDSGSGIGEVRAVAARTQDVMAAIIDLAAFFHPDADLRRLAELLPPQLQLGISRELAPLAVAGASLSREHYLALLEKKLTTPERIHNAPDSTILPCVGGAGARLRTLRDAVSKTLAADAFPLLAGALPPPID